MENNYEIGSLLGKGSFASVYLARDARTSNKRRVALKLINVTEYEQQYSKGSIPGDCNEQHFSITDILQREIDIHSSLSVSSHPNVVQFIESFAYTTSNECRMKALIIEYCSRGDLHCFIKRIRDEHRNGMLLKEGTFLKNDEIQHSMTGILRGLSFLHSRGIVHRDIKASNVFLSPIHGHEQFDAATPLINRKAKTTDQFTLLDCQLKLGDFGLAVQMDDDEDWYESRNTLCGTPSCLAPEVARGARKYNCENEENNDWNNILTLNSPHCERDETDSLDGLININKKIDSLLIHQCNNEETSQSVTRYGQPADLWSVGCLLYTMIVGRNPFALPCSHRTITCHGESETKRMELKMRRVQETIDRVLRADWSIPSNVCMQPALETLLNQLLEINPRKRGTARSILAYHPYFRLDLASHKLATTTTDKCSIAISIAPSIIITGATKSACIDMLNDKENVNNCNSQTIESNKISEDDQSDTIASNCLVLGTEHKKSNCVIASSDVLIPMTGLCRLPHVRYKWKEKKHEFALYVLGNEGLVFQRESLSRGFWMHVTVDGQWVYCEEFEPKKYCAYPNTRQNSHQNAVQNFKSEVFQTASKEFHIAKINASKLYRKPLASLFNPECMIQLHLYRVLERLVYSIKSSTPKITLYLFTEKASANNDPSLHQYDQTILDSCEMFGKAMLMQNGDIGDFEMAFVDGTTFQLLWCSRNMVFNWKDGEMDMKRTLKLDSNEFLQEDFVQMLLSKNLCPYETEILHTFSHHISIMHAAFHKCKDFELSNERNSAGSQRYPMALKICVTCLERIRWVVLEQSDAVGTMKF